MDYDVPMTGIPDQGEIRATDIRGDFLRQEAVLIEFTAKLAQDMAGIKNGLNSLSQQVEAVPARVAEGMTKAGIPLERERRSLIPGFGWYLQTQNQDQIAGLQGETKALTDRNIALHRKLEAVQRELDAARQKAAGMEGQLRGSQEEVKKLRGKEAALRTIILDQAGVQKISDDEIRQGFLKLRQDIQKLSCRPCYSVETDPVVSAAQQGEALPSSSAAFYSQATWGLLRVKDRRCRMRAKIYEELHYHILDYNSFGLQLFEAPVLEGAENGFVEPGLQRFEYALKERGVDDGLISDWRISTINCVERAGFEDATSLLASTDIFSLLAPLLSKHVLLSEEEALRMSILELCKDALKLRMKMRKSKDRYLVLTVGAGNPLPTVESMVEVVAVEGGKAGEESDEIAYTMFGVLAKRAQAEGQPMKVLEKAHIVLRRK